MAWAILTWVQGRQAILEQPTIVWKAAKRAASFACGVVTTAASTTTGMPNSSNKRLLVALVGSGLALQPGREEICNGVCIPFGVGSEGF